MLDINLDSNRCIEDLLLEVNSTGSVIGEEMLVVYFIGALHVFVNDHTCKGLTADEDLLAVTFIKLLL